MEENLEIILNFFKPINLLSPTTPPAEESDTENNGDTQIIQPHSRHDQDQLESQAVNVINGNNASNFNDTPSNRTNINCETGETSMSNCCINEVNIVADEADSESTQSASNFTGNGTLDENGIDAFVRRYGRDTVINIFKSITSYAPENMMTLMHRFEEERKITSKRTHKSILKIEMNKLQDQILKREKYHKEHLLRIMLLSPNDDHMQVQKKCLFNFLTVRQLTYVVLEMDGHLDVIEELEQLKDIEENNKKEKNKYVKDNCQKRLKEITWAYIEKILMNVTPIRSECRICFLYPIEYAIVDCGHYRLCKSCKDKIETDCEPRCPFCNTTITNFIKIYE